MARHHEPRIPTSGPRLAEALGRVLFKCEEVDSDYGRCVQISQLLFNTARVIEESGDLARAQLVRKYAESVSAAGNEL